MSDLTKSPPKAQSAEEWIRGLLSQLGHHLRGRYEQGQSHIRKSPNLAVFLAAAAGFLLHRLPVRLIVIAFIRVLLALVTPALILFGTAKIYEVLGGRNPENQK